MSNAWKIFSDFDGTISLIDTCDLIIDYCIGRETRQMIDDQIVSGELSFRQGLTAQYNGVNLTWAEACQRLKVDEGLDSTFIPFVQWVRKMDIPLVVLSSGLEQVIALHFKAVGLTDLEIRANQVQVENRTWHISFRDDTPFGHDKAAALKEAQAAGYKVVFIGDGISDMPAAHQADLLFAKKGDRLAEYCDENGIAYHPFENFADVLAVLKSRNLRLKQDTPKDFTN